MMSDIKDQYQSDDLTKLQFEHAWRWFDGHAKQRAAIFSYFLIITGILMNALVKEASSEFPFAFYGICVLGVVTAVGFLVFDVRNRGMMREAEGVLLRLEKDRLFPDNFTDDKGKRLGCLLVEEATGMLDRSGNWKKRGLRNFLKHKIWIRGIEAGVALCFVLILLEGP